MGFTIEEAEDLAQDVFVTFIESLERFEGRAQIGTWLFGILHHKAQECRRSRARDELNDPIDTVFEAQFDIRGNWIRPPLTLTEPSMHRKRGRRFAIASTACRRCSARCFSYGRWKNSRPPMSVMFWRKPSLT